MELSLQERRRGRKVSTEGGYILSSLRKERLGEKGGAFFNGKEGRDDFRKKIDDFRNQNPFSIQKDYQSSSAPHVSYPSPKD